LWIGQKLLKHSCEQKKEGGKPNLTQVGHCKVQPFEHPGVEHAFSNIDFSIVFYDDLISLDNYFFKFGFFEFLFYYFSVF